MLSNPSFRFPALLLGLVLTAACPLWDRPGSSGDTEDAGASDDGAAVVGDDAAAGSFVGTPPGGRTSTDAGTGSGSATVGGGSGSTSATGPTAGSSGAGAAAGSGAGSTGAGAAAGSAAGGDGIGGDGSGADPFGGGGVTGTPDTDPNDLPLDDGTGAAGGVGGTIGMGQWGGSTGAGGAMDDPNAPPAARLSQWSGRWNGTVTYHVLTQVGYSVFTGPDIEPVPQTMPAAMRIDAIDYDPATGYASITARIAAADCLLTSDLTGSVFFGDDLSPVSSPILALQAAGANKTGEYLAMRMNATRAFNAIEGTLNFQGVDMLPQPCNEPNLAFRFDRVMPTPK